MSTDTEIVAAQAAAALAPPRVGDRYAFWSHPPPERSARCAWWVRRIEGGWRRNRRISGMGYDEASEHFGVYVWEYTNVLAPLLATLEDKEGRR